MMSTVAVDEAIRTLSIEMSKSNDATFIGKTEAEIEILSHYADKGRRRAVMGAIAGSSVMMGLWKISKNPKRLAGAFAMMSGGLFGASYGIISIRRDLFSDLLVLPSDKSPFASRARNILMTKIPDNAFVQELNEKLKHSTATTDLWNDDADAKEGFDSKPSTTLVRARHQSHDDISSSTPLIVGLDIPRNEQHTSDEAAGELNDNERRSPFFFGAKPSLDASPAHKDRNTPLSRDPFAHYSRDYRPRESDENAASLRHDEDHYFFGVASESDAPVKPTTWEEIRRRAAEQRK